MAKATPYSKKLLYDFGSQKTYQGQHSLQIAMPIGGIGAGATRPWGL